MDCTTEPVIAVIDHPIAGNPTQFALERALNAMELEIRVLSFQVDPAQLGAALNGLEALGFRGVAVGETLAELSAQWAAMRSNDEAIVPNAVDCFHIAQRDEGDGTDSSQQTPEFVGTNCRQAFLEKTIVDHFATRGRSTEKTLLVGSETEFDAGDSIHLGTTTRMRSAPDGTDLADADLIIIGDPHFDLFGAEANWPKNDSSALVVDLTDTGHPGIDLIENQGYRCININQRRAGTLLQSLENWSGRSCSADVIVDAIEEYLAI